MIRGCWTFDPTPLSKTGNGVKFPGARFGKMRSVVLSQHTPTGVARRINQRGLESTRRREGPQKLAAGAEEAAWES